MTFSLKSCQEAKEIVVQHPKSGIKYTKSIVPVGGKRIQEILTDLVLSAKENCILVRVTAKDRLVERIEQADEAIKKQLVQKKKTKSTNQGETAEKPPTTKTNGLTTNKMPSSQEIVDIKSDIDPYEEEMKGKMSVLLEKNKALSRFIQSRFNPKDFKVNVSSSLMKSLILETARFNSKREEVDPIEFLKVGRSRTQVSESFLRSFDNSQVYFKNPPIEE